MKICSKCKKQKELTEFHRDCSKKDGRRTICAWCERTFKPVDAICYQCREWYTKTRSAQKFCRRKCSTRYWGNIRNKSAKGWARQRRYLERHRKELSARSLAWYYANRERALLNNKLWRQKKAEIRKRAMYV